MVSKFLDALKRADRSILGAFVLVLATAGAAIGYAPSTDYVRAVKPVVHQVAQEQAEAAVLQPRNVGASPTEIAMMKLLAERRCLAEALYYEARGEGVQGQRAVAEVIFHRMNTSVYPSTICGVVYQGSHKRHGCQFSFTCNGELRRPKSAAAWARARQLAARIVMGTEPLGDITGDATSYHAADVDPDWAGTMVRTVQIGNHIFYRRASRTRDM